MEDRRLLGIGNGCFEWRLGDDEWVTVGQAYGSGTVVVSIARNYERLCSALRNSRPGCMGSTDRVEEWSRRPGTVLGNGTSGKR